MKTTVSTVVSFVYTVFAFARGSVGLQADIIPVPSFFPDSIIAHAFKYLALHI